MFSGVVAVAALLFNAFVGKNYVAAMWCFVAAINAGGAAFANWINYRGHHLS